METEEWGGSDKGHQRPVPEKRSAFPESPGASEVSSQGLPVEEPNFNGSWRTLEPAQELHVRHNRGGGFFLLGVHR